MKDLQITEAGRGKFIVTENKTGERLGVFLTLQQANAFATTLTPPNAKTKSSKKKSKPTKKGKSNAKKESK